MAVLTTAMRKALPKSKFAVPSKAPGPGSFPMPDASHARNALARASQHGTPAVKSAVRSKVKKLFSGVKQSKPAKPAVNDHDADDGY